MFSPPDRAAVPRSQPQHLSASGWSTTNGEDRRWRRPARGGVGDVDSMTAQNLDNHVGVQMLDAVRNDRLGDGSHLPPRSFSNSAILARRATMSERLSASSMLTRPSARTSTNTQRLVASQSGDPRWSGNQMTLLGGRRPRTVFQPNRANARATGRLVIKQTQPLCAAAAPRANEQRPPSPALAKAMNLDPDRIADVVELNGRRPHPGVDQAGSRHG